MMYPETMPPEMPDGKPGRKKILPLNSVIVRFAALMLIMLAVPFSIVFLITANRLSRMEKESANQFLSSNLHTAAGTLDQVLMNLERLHAFIFIDTHFINSIRRLSPYDNREEYDDYINTNGIKNRINHVAATNNYIYSIYAYSFQAERIFSSRINWDAAFNRFPDAPWLRSYRESGEQGSPWILTQDIQDDRPLLASYREVWANNQPTGLVSVNVDTAEIAKMLDGVIPSESGSAFILDSRGELIAGTGPALIDRLIPQIPPHQNEGFFDTIHEGEELFIAFYTSPYSGFKFAAAAPLDQIQTSTPVMIRLTMLFLLLLILLIALSLFLAHYYFWSPVRILFAGMRQIQEGNFSTRLPQNPTYEFGYINNNFNIMVENIQKLIEENYASKLLRKEAQLKNIQDQVNEHFLYNTLDSIHWLARKENALQASQMVFALANFYRISLSSGQDIISVRDAADMIRNYLYIQKARMPDTLSYSIDCDPSLESVSIPKGLLQPLVENSLKHGLQSLNRPGAIHIVFERRSAAMRVSVTDTGRGFTEERLREVQEQLKSPHSRSKESFALKTVQSQIQLYYDIKNAIHIETKPGQGTVIFFEVPATGVALGSDQND